MIILGIDPGVATIGYGVVAKSKTLKCLDYGCIRTASSLPITKRLASLYSELNSLIRKHKPKVLAVENVYFFKNLKTAMPVSQAKGVILLAAALKRIRVREFTPLQIKTAVTGYGRAEKIQVQKMIKALLGLEELPRPDDAADALGAAICAGLDSSS